jgi:uncharacterized protein (TIGR02996 family)
MTTNSDDAAFLRAICAEPADVRPRRIYADYLDERGDPDRAAYIRASCDLAAEYGDPPYRCGSNGQQVGHPTLYRPRCRCPVCSLLRRQHMASRRWIHVAWEPEITAPFWAEFERAAGAWRFGCGQPHPQPPRVTVSFRRGFVAEITCDWPAWRDHAGAVRAATPLERVCLTSWPVIDIDWTNPAFRGGHCRLVGGRLGLCWVGPLFGNATPTERTNAISKAVLAAEHPGIAFELPWADASRTDVVASFDDLLTSLEDAGLTGQ